MFTLGFRFKPWTSDKAIADGPSILNYIKEAAAENGIDKHIRYGHKVVAARLVRRGQPLDGRQSRRDGEVREISCAFLFACSGYYNYDEGYSPEFAGSRRLRGHHRPPAALAGGSRLRGQEDRRHRQWRHRRHVDSRAGQRGAGPRHDAAALADLHRRRCPTSTRSPSRMNKYAARERRLRGQPLEGHRLQHGQYQLARKFPKFMRKTLMTMAKRRLPEGYDVEKHFGPSYNPWDQRLCLAPNGDLFKTIRKGKADVVTDTIERFYRDRHQADLRRGARGRHHRHRNGFEHAAVRRRGDPPQRRADRPARR